MEMAEEKLKWILPSDHPVIRADICLAALIPDFTRAAISRMIREGRVLADGERLAKAGFKVRPGNVLEIILPRKQPTDAVARDLPFTVVYEDNDILVVNKPRGMVVHPAAGHRDDTLVNALLSRYGNQLSAINGEIRPGIVHRLDKDTSGLMLVARNNRAHLGLSEQLKRHTVRRIYTVLTDGTPSLAEFIVEAPIGRHPVQRKKMAVTEKGRPARTRFTMLEAFRGAACLQAALETGRTHQIRVHLAFAGYPVLGDPLYNPKRSDLYRSLATAIPDLPAGQWLHAGSLTFRHPVLQTDMSFEAPLPPELEHVLQWLRENRKE